MSTRRPAPLWARRSLFSLENQPILVTEVFLPATARTAMITTERIAERLTEYEKLMRLDKPIGILLLAWPTLWGLWLSSAGAPDPIVFWVFAMGTVLMRSAGCVVNDYADRNFDRHVERTKNRPLAAGRVSEKEALILAAVLAVLAFLLILPLKQCLPSSSVRRRRLPGRPATPSPSVSWPFPRPTWASPSASASPWLRRPPGRGAPHRLGADAPPTCSGPSPTTPNTPWWTGPTT
jgi:hypothetical protein